VSARYAAIWRCPPPYPNVEPDPGAASSIPSSR